MAHGESDMEIDVLTVNDVEIKKWRWWSNWVDVSVFDQFDVDGYLLQMKVSRWNSKKFKCVPFRRLFSDVHPSTSQAGHLTQAGRSALQHRAKTRICT